MPESCGHRQLVALVAAVATALPGIAHTQQAHTQQAMGARGDEARSEPRTGLSAKDVAYAVADELATDALVSLEAVEVGTADAGVVRLTGEVNSLLAKERAARIAETVKGVQRVDNELTVIPRRALSAEDIETAISTALTADPATDGFQVEVQADSEGRVTLTGEANSRAEYQLIGRVAKAVGGVTAVANDVRINYQPARSDWELLQEIRSRLRWDAHIDDASIDVEVDNSSVTLTGVVGSAAEKARARAIAWSADSKAVDVDGLRVATWSANSDTRIPAKGASVPAARATDRDIAQAVDAALQRNLRLATVDLEVQVEDHTVTLRGQVENLKAKRAAFNEASAIDGVERVRDRIRVLPGKDAPSDENIKEQVRTALLNDPVVEPYPIKVDVDDGAVDLHGHVDTWFERGTADDVAARINGVLSVDNHIVVLNTNDRVSYEPYVDNWSIDDYDWYDPPTAPTRWRPDWEIAQEIRDQLWWSPFVDENRIEVRVRGGIATLTGKVDGYAQRRIATENAFEGGAIGVVNELVVAG